MWSAFKNASSSSSSSTTASQHAAISAAWWAQKAAMRLPFTGLLSPPAAAVFSTTTSSSTSLDSVAAVSSNQPVPASSNHSLEACLNLMHHLASGTTDSNQNWLNHFKKHQRTEADRWVCTKCGEWEGHPQGWTGPALALMQLWPVKCFKDEHDIYDYMLWELNSSGLPTGKAYTSASALESLSDRKENKHPSDSITVLERIEPDRARNPRSSRLGTSCMAMLVHGKLVAGVRLSTWLKQNLHVGRTMRKSASAQKVTYTPSEDTKSPRSWGGWPTASSKTNGALATSASKTHTRSQRLPGTASQHSGRRARGRPRLMRTNKAGPASAETMTPSTAAIAAASQDGPAPHYVYPGPPSVQSTQLHMSKPELYRRKSLLASIQSGKIDLSATHIPLSAFMPEYQQEVPTETGNLMTAAAAVSPKASSADVQHLHQLCRIEDLEQRAVAAEAAQQRQGDIDSNLAPVVPDATKPFTITMTNGRDGQQYVVAHYEPDALKDEQQVLSAQLCTVFSNRSRQQKIKRVSAAAEEWMVMSGTRTPVKGGSCARYGRYHGDTDAESDGFAAAAWPYLRMHGRFSVISRFWIHKLAKEIQQHNIRAAKDVGNRHSKHLTAVNYPSPCFWGSPFTSLGITQNYHSKLHCEPGEHPFSFITWQDLLCPGARLEVGYFWLTAGLAFLPRPGSALYIDVRLVTHRSEPCVVTDRRFGEEGRYGCALFIKPPVLKKNAHLWAEFDAVLHRKQLRRKNELMRQQMQENEQLLADADVSVSSSDDDVV